MSHWIDTYPHRIYASVLLLDNKIYSYKIGQGYWEHPYEVTMRISDFKKTHRMKVENKFWEVNNNNEHGLVFEKYARQWFKKWEIHEEHIGTPPYVREDKMNEELKTFHEWEDEFGVKVLDPEGFENQSNLYKRLMSKEEFQNGLNGSTIHFEPKK